MGANNTDGVMKTVIWEGAYILITLLDGIF